MVIYPNYGMINIKVFSCAGSSMNHKFTDIQKDRHTYIQTPSSVCIKWAHHGIHLTPLVPRSPIDSPSLPLTPIYYLWLSMTTHDSPWLPLNPLNSQWLPLNPLDSSWPPLTPLRCAAMHKCCACFCHKRLWVGGGTFCSKNL